MLVYDLGGDVATHLNRTAALVWRNCDGTRTVQELVTLIVKEFGEAADEDVVLMALDTLSEHGLIDSGYGERDGAAVALSRRRFFRRVGVVGAAALNAPVAYSMVVPTAAAALSNGGSQANNNDQSQLLNQSQRSSGQSSQSSGQSSQSSGEPSQSSGEAYP